MGYVGDKIGAHGFESLDFRDVVKDQDRSYRSMSSMPQAHGVDAKQLSFVQLDFLRIPVSREVESEHFLDDLPHFGMARQLDDGNALDVAILGHVKHLLGLLVNDQNGAAGVQNQHSFQHALQYRIALFLFRDYLVDIMADFCALLI